MKFTGLFAGAVALALAMPAWADIAVSDAYARSAMATARTGAAFMVIGNTGTEDDRLVGATSDAADRVELHTHVDAGNGVMQMREVEDGFVIPAGASHALQRGGDHVMFLGLTRPFVQGETVTVTLHFEKAGDVVVDIPVDLERMPEHGMGQGMQQGHGAMGGAGN